MISIVIPLYNKRLSIATTLQSVISQTYTDWECIIVDDGSTDGSLDVVKNYIRKWEIEDRRLKILHQENSGVAAARNKGIMEANGKYIVFLDADDLWGRDFLTEMVKLIADYPERSIYGLGCVPIKQGQLPELKKFYYRGISTWNYETMAFTGSSVCVNKKDAIEVGLFDTRMTHGEDLDMWWRLMLLHGGVSYLHPYAYYIQDAENRAMHRLAPLEKHIPYYLDKFADARAQNVDFRRFFDREMIYRLYPYLFDKRYRTKAMELAKSFDYSLQKKSMKWRMHWPHVYRLYQKLTGK